MIGGLNQAGYLTFPRSNSAKKAQQREIKYTSKETLTIPMFSQIETDMSKAKEDFADKIQERNTVVNTRPQSNAINLNQGQIKAQNIASTLPPMQRRIPGNVVNGLAVQLPSYAPVPQNALLGIKSAAFDTTGGSKDSGTGLDQANPGSPNQGSNVGNANKLTQNNQQNSNKQPTISTNHNSSTNAVNPTRKPSSRKPPSSPAGGHDPTKSNSLTTPTTNQPGSLARSPTRQPSKQSGPSRPGPTKAAAKRTAAI